MQIEEIESSESLRLEYQNLKFISSQIIVITKKLSILLNRVWLCPFKADSINAETVIDIEKCYEPFALSCFKPTLPRNNLM